MRINNLIAALFLVFSATACTPIIHELRVIDANNNSMYEHDEVLTVETEVTVRRGGADTPIVSTRPHFPAESNYQQSAQLTDRTLIGNNNGFDKFLYSGQLNLDYGAYDLRVSVPYSSWTAQLKQVSDPTSLFVEGPDYCFDFDDHSTMGFSMSPIFDSDEQALPGNVNLGTKIRNWPEDKTGHGSVGFRIESQYFPGPPEETRFWYIDFISPDLSQINAWQQSQGVSFRVLTSAGSLFAQPILYIQGQDINSAPKDPQSGEYLYYPVASETVIGASTWNIIQWSSTPDLPDDVREKVHIRIVGDADATGVNNNKVVFLDAVCPVPPEISPAGGVVSEPAINPIE